MAEAGFFAKFSSDGSTLLWAAYVPVVAAPPYFVDVLIAAITFDASGNAAGTSPNGLNVTAGALQTSFPGAAVVPVGAGFVMKFNSGAQELLFSTYFGAEGEVDGVAVDSQGVIWVTGASPPGELPVTNVETLLGEDYLAGISPDGSSLSALFTAPSGMAGLGIILSPSGVTSLGGTGALLTASAGAGPSLVGIANSAGSTVSNAVAPYELISLYGLGLGPQPPMSAQVVNGVTGNSLGGVQVLFDQTPAPLLYVGPDQINAIVPSEIYGQDTTTIQVVTPAGALSGPTMNVSPSQPGVLLSSAPNSTLLAPPAAALNQDGSVNSAANPAALGSIVSVWVSGAGISTVPVPDGTIRSSAEAGVPTLPVVAFSSPVLVLENYGGFSYAGLYAGLSQGPLSLEVVYAGDAVGMVAGASQINFLLPTEVESGVDNVGFWLQIGEASTELFTLYLEAPQ